MFTIHWIYPQSEAHRHLRLRMHWELSQGDSTRHQQKLAVTPINFTLPDGATIHSTHTCDLLLPQLPLAATKAHIIPGLSISSLLSVGQLVDANCSVKFDRTSVEVLQNQEWILEGVRNVRNGLWTVDLEENNSHTNKDEITTPNSKSEQANRVYECTNKRDLLRFLHVTVFSQVQDTWLNVKLLPLPQPPVRARTDARTNPSAQRAAHLRSVLARAYAVSIQNQITTTVP
jgi:hypothetical protein